MDAVMRVILPVHRYLGVAVGLIMTLWCLSGFVMMYQGFPSLPDSERVGGLPSLALEDCCDLEALPFDDALPAPDFRVEMMADKPVLRVGAQEIYDLRTGAPLPAPTEADARAAAAALRTSRGLSGEPVRVVTLDRVDQWTLQIFRRHAPLWRLDYAEPAGASLYVSGRTGEVVQETTARTRTLAWLGAIPHWLYPTVLRQNGPLWSQVVIWSSIVGVFLTATGLFVGFVRLKGRSGRWFPYRRVWLWHHVVGVFFGILTLTWTYSGLLTMDPWGAFTSSPPVGSEEVNGRLTWGETRALIARAPEIAARGEIKQLRNAPLAGEPFLVVQGPDGATSRWGLEGGPSIAEAEALEAALRPRAPALAQAEVTLQETEDAYYYGHKGRPVLPVLRVELRDAADTILYIEPATGDVVRFVDNVSRQRRWLESGFHSLDFPVLRWRPVWDVVTILLLAGVTAVCATGTWLAFQRVKRDLTPGVRFRRDPRQLQAE